MKITITSTVCRTVQVSKPRNKSLSLALGIIAVSSPAIFTSCGDDSPSRPTGRTSLYEDSSTPETECANLSTENIYKWRKELQGYIDEAYPLYAKTKAIAELSPPTEKRILTAKNDQLKTEMNKWQDSIDDMNQELKNRGLQ